MRFLFFVGKRRPKSLADAQSYAEANPKNRNASPPKGQKVPKGVKGQALKGRKQK